MNPILRGWVNYFRIGHSSSVFNEVRAYALRRVRRYIRRRQGKHGYGWKNLPNEFFYGSLGLFYSYQLTGRPAPAWKS
jgi:RNA-directed DNA polymerase